MAAGGAAGGLAGSRANPDSQYYAMKCRKSCLHYWFSTVYTSHLTSVQEENHLQQASGGCQQEWTSRDWQGWKGCRTGFCRHSQPGSRSSSSSSWWRGGGGGGAGPSDPNAVAMHAAQKAEKRKKEAADDDAYQQQQQLMMMWRWYSANRWGH